MKKAFKQHKLSPIVKLKRHNTISFSIEGNDIFIIERELSEGHWNNSKTSFKGNKFFLEAT